MAFTAKQLRNLGKTDIKISPIGLGTWQFSGQAGFAGSYWDTLSEDTIRDIIKASLEGGVNWFDTAEFYGHGQSEKNLSRALCQLGCKNGDVVIATKWWPILKFASNIKATINDRIECLSPFPVDLHMIHQPFSFSSIDKQMDAMADLLEASQIRAVGVSNFSAKNMLKAHRALEKRGILLASNQMRYSLLFRDIENNGILEYAKELGITIIAWSPLEQGMLTGKFHNNPDLTKNLNWFRKLLFTYSAKRLEESRPLIEALQRIGEKHNASCSQVALNWLTHFHGNTVVAIPGASNVKQAKENVGAMDFILTTEEMAEIDQLSKIFG